MLTIYAGPFEEDFCVKSVKKEFGRCGPIQSLTVVTETFQVSSTQRLLTGLEDQSNLLKRDGLEPQKYQLLCLEVFSGSLVISYNHSGYLKSCSTQ